MKALFFVWGFFAFSILGFKLLPKTETLALQDFESNFVITDYPEEFLPGWSANEVRSGTSRVFRAQGKGINASTALGVQTIGSFDAQIYIKTSTIGLKSNRISFWARTERNGSGNRPVNLAYSFSFPPQQNSSEKFPIGDSASFPNADTEYREFELFIPEGFMEQEGIIIHLEVNYGEGGGSAARFYMDDWVFHGAEDADDVDIPETSPEEELPLAITGIQQVDEYSLEVIFNQPIQEPTGGLILSNGYGAPTSVQLSEERLSLSFEDYLYSNTYQLELERVQVANKELTLENAAYSFEINFPTPVGAVIINEFMADPNPKSLSPPQSALPTAANDEYIELYNRMDKPIRVKDFTYNGGIIEDAVIPPTSLLLLAAASKKETFSSFGTAASVAPFRALPNSSGEIILADPFGNVIDSLSYDTSWYQHAQKSQGGWSLERINPQQSCSDSFNWKASESATGGTPGSQNSLYSLEPDDRPFDIIRLIPISDNKLEISFSKLLPETVLILDDMTIDGHVTHIDSASQNTIWLNLANQLISGKRHVLSLGSFTDCYGQNPKSSEYIFVYDTDPPKLLHVGGLAPNEVRLYYDEALRPNSVDKSSSFEIESFQGEITQVIQSSEYQLTLILNRPLQLDSSYVLIVEGVADTFGNVQPRTVFPFYWEDGLDSVYFASPTSLFVKFDQPVNADSARLRRNYFLNRNLGTPNVVLPEPDDPTTFQLFYEQQFPTNLPIEVQVTGMVSEEGKYLSTHKRSFTWDTRAIAISEIQVLDSTSLRLIFNKGLDEKWVNIPQNFLVNQGVGVPDRIYQPTSNILELFFKDSWKQQTSYQVSIKELRDLFGQAMTRTLNGSFFYDTTQPILDSLFLLSPYELVLQSNKPIAVPDSIRINGQWMTNVVLKGDDQLLLTSSLPWNAGWLEILIPTLEDISGNIAKDLTLNWDHGNVRISFIKIIHESSLVIGFTDYLDPVTSIFGDRYQINNKSAKEVELLSSGYEVQLQLDHLLVEGDSLSLEVSEVQTLSEKAGQNLVYHTVYSDYISDIWVEQAQLIRIIQEVPLSEQNPFFGEFEWVDETFETEVLVNPSQRNQFQLVLDRELPNDRNLQLRIPPRMGRNGAWLPGSLRTLRWDNTPPKLQSVEALSANEFVLQFDEMLDPVLAVVPGFYQISGQSPSEVVFGEEKHLVVLVFDEAFSEVDSLTLVIEQIEDLNRNSVNEIRYKFEFSPPQAPSFRQLIINEIMPAPRAGGLLPNAEYVELYNASDYEIQLSGLRFGNSRTYTTLARSTLAPGEFIILCPQNQIAEFSKYGRVIGLSQWPTMLNAGDEMWLADPKGNLIDRVKYDNGTFGSSSIAQGGFSLEIVNPFYPCETPANIRPSLASERGTPGRINSVFDGTPDRIAPRLLKAEVYDSTELYMTFSKPVTPQNLQSIFQINPQLEVSGVRLDEENPYRISLQFSEEFESNQAYTVTVSNWRDCSGNSLDLAANFYTFKIPGVAKSGDVALNEILFNPKTGAPKFVEIYNSSNQYINMKNWKLANIANGEIANRRVISSQDLILDPFSFQVLTTDATILASHFPKGKAETFYQLPLPSYPISSGSVVLLNPEEDLIEQFDYHERFHHSFLREFRGVSLERYALDAPANDPKNWHSAAATEGYATPGYRNSQVYDPGNLEKGIHISPQVFIPDAVGEKPFTTISYTLDQPGFLATLRIFSPNGLLIQELCQNEVWGQEGFYTWDGTDQKGRRVGAGYYIVWVEMFHPDGRVEQIKKTVVVGTKF
ncbi:lamin tail domain-containing protein [Lunatibacter salilacus]|uniref:lamin tail domain-containing protein n=1 Tax=Lunatibacter salilacus TaxID=2483804 RepID=UPI00131D78D6|nr:lamin tail domain-containing protein [Lunatibacter salilacus]